MANDSDYTITTLSNNLNQRNKPVFSQAGNNTITLRDKCSPYTLVASPEGDINRSIVKFPFGCVTASSVASCVTTLNVPSAEYATLPLAVAAIPTGVPLTCSYVINLSGSTTYFHNNLPLINVDATEDFFVTLQAWEGTIDGGKPIIDGSGAAFYIFDVANVDYTVIDGIHFKTWSSSQSGLVWGGNSSQVISGTVKNCTIDATNGGKYGLRIAGTSFTAPTKGLIVENCTFTGTVGSTTNGVDGIRATAVENITVQDCTFTGWTTSGIEGTAVWFDASFGSGGDEIGGHTVRRNIIHDNDGDGIRVVNQENVTIVNNLFYNSASFSDAGQEIRLEGNIDGLNVYYNTLVQKNSSYTQGGLLKFIPGATLAGTASIKNNLYRYDFPGSGPGTNGAIQGWEITTGQSSSYLASTSDYNLFSVVNPDPSTTENDYVAGVKHGGGFAYANSLVSWQGGFSPDFPGHDANSLSVSGAIVNIFTDETNHDYTLIAGSDALSAGTPITGITTDILGNPRNVTNPSIGCYES